VLGPLRVSTAALFLVGILLAGCYTLEPVSGVDPKVGSRVAFDVNDNGRVALGGTMGPEIAQVEGQLVQKEDGLYVVAVSSVRLLRGSEQPWSGEQVRLKTEYLGPAYERKLSKGRSIGLALAGVGGVTAFFITRSLLGFGNEDNGTPGDTTINTRLGRP
jgi:hypothetical protein